MPDITDFEPMQEEVYFNTRTSVCKLDGNGNIVEIHAPGLEGKNLMFGFTLRGWRNTNFRPDSKMPK